MYTVYLQAEYLRKKIGDRSNVSVKSALRSQLCKEGVRLFESFELVSSERFATVYELNGACDACAHTDRQSKKQKNKNKEKGKRKQENFRKIRKLGTSGWKLAFPSRSYRQRNTYTIPLCTTSDLYMLLQCLNLRKETVALDTQCTYIHTYILIRTTTKYHYTLQQMHMGK